MIKYNVLVVYSDQGKLRSIGGFKVIMNNLTLKQVLTLIDLDHSTSLKRCCLLFSNEKLLDQSKYLKKKKREKIGG